VVVPSRREICHSLSLFSKFGKIAFIFPLCIAKNPVRLSAKICLSPFFSFFPHYIEIDAEIFLKKKTSHF
jgi:hypothetical protein